MSGWKKRAERTQQGGGDKPHPMGGVSARDAVPADVLHVVLVPVLDRVPEHLRSSPRGTQVIPSRPTDLDAPNSAAAMLPGGRPSPQQISEMHYLLFRRTHRPGAYLERCCSN